ncbi:RNA polymerase sigma factor [Sphingomonas koreensis]|jgi:RNA polymerase sigma-70 factor (ECF subfamily)|uniref:RNA polymerase sigma factor n=2 Tax=Sphingomonadaceae TaxID=41297 RepID=UPI0009E912B2|nr:RNA polymerase sigma factor [Sphingomonas koreensis]
MAARMIGGFLRPATIPRLDEDDPLPPEDRVVRPSLALDDLYRVHGPRLLRYFSRRADRQDAGDLVHESFVRFANSDACRERAIECPEAYLNQIATNLLRDRAKSAVQRSLASHVAADEVPLAGPDLVAALEARDKLNRLQTALMRLKPKTREIFLAHRLDGLSYKQIAERSGLSVKGVEWHMTKAIDHLDRVLRR